MISTGRYLRSLTTLLRDGGPRLAAFMALLATMAAGSKEAHAGVDSITDAFDNFAEWSPWTSSRCQTFSVRDASGVPRISRSASRMGAIDCNWSSSEFGLIDKVFNDPGTRTPTSCKATVYVKNGAGTPIDFALQMINADDWTYIGSTSISFAVSIPPPPATWTPVTVTNTYGCSRSINVRIGITGSNIVGSPTYVLLDDLKVEWFY
jgi:hypothetical protein